MSVNKAVKVSKAKDLEAVDAKTVVPEASNDPTPPKSLVNKERLSIPDLAGSVDLVQPTPDMLGNIVASALKAIKVKLGTLTINGVLAEPVKTGVKINRNLTLDDSTNPAGSFYIPWGLLDASAEKLFNQYLITQSNGVKDYYLVCEESEVVVDNVSPAPFARGLTVSTSNLLILVNSKSVTDTIVGTNTLVNASTSYCILNNSDIKTNESDPGTGFNLHRRAKYPPFGKPGQTARRSYEYAHLKKCNLVNTGVTKGHYVRMSAYDSEVDGTCYTGIKDVDLNKTVVRGASIKLANANFYETTIQAERDVTVQNGQYRNETFRDKQIFIQNRFDYLNITSISGEVSMTRSSQDEFDLGLGYYNSKTFSLVATRQEIEDHIKTLFNGSPQPFGYAPTPTDDPIMASVVAYTVDAVCSRLKVINMLRAVKNLSGFLNEPYDKYEDMYEA